MKSISKKMIYAFMLAFLLGSCNLNTRSFKEDTLLKPKDVLVKDSENFNIKAKKQSVEGWSSQTGYKQQDTTIRRNIVAKALNSVGNSSGQSTTMFNGRNASWLTDIADGDGVRIRKGFLLYDGWFKEKKPKKKTLASLKTDIYKVFSGSGYQKAQKDALVNRIELSYLTRYPFSLFSKNFSLIPVNDEETLAFLGFRKQCLEWVITTSLNAGGANINYKNAVGVSKDNVRPGMGFYNINTHAMIIVDVKYDASGNPIKLKVAESNYPEKGNKWLNPNGDIPWERKISLREVNFGYTIVNFG